MCVYFAQVPWEEWVLRIVVKNDPGFGCHHDLLRKEELVGRCLLCTRIHTLIHTYKYILSMI